MKTKVLTGINIQCKDLSITVDTNDKIVINRNISEFHGFENIILSKAEWALITKVVRKMQTKLKSI